ncbi:MSCRAMM family protein [Tessaracoccus defluvii]|uniref:Prealbumin-like fold domain-containing protein n=1 Tax=Tessaracoccus defluvii TaxID=1285901 RepID=A0A7H0H441_9ACTN|nr:prealbumin-like fold domain-containing protein [Tessaracoccus defluvii]QNP55307.1 prealbumin-like fold domain-containing protein [Tessaracoccus defluvii]
MLGSVAWAKVAKGGQTPLQGSEWKIVGPDPSSTELVVIDCVTADAAQCTGPDKDPAAGKFLVKELAWGKYSLIETAAPPGYVRNATEVEFTVGRPSGNDAMLAWNLGSIENVQRTGPVLPLTGGLGRDQIMIIGALMALLAVAGFGARRFRAQNS